MIISGRNQKPFTHLSPHRRPGGKLSMSSNTDFFNTLLWFLYQLWPLMLFAGLQGALGSRKVSFLKIMRRMFLIWCSFALIGFYLLIADQLGNTFLIQEPLNSILFVSSGALFGGVFFLLASKDKRRIRRELKQSSSLADLRELSPDDFEKVVVEIFNQAGVKAEQVGESGDHGIDVVLESKTGKHWVAQCKRYKGKVGEPVIRDFYGAMLHEQATRGFMITTGTFTRQARAWSEGKPIILWDGDKLYALIE